MANRVAAFRRPAKKIDFKQWTSVPGQSQNQVANGTVAASGSLGFSAPATILRVRGVIAVAFNGGSQIADEAEITMGLGVFSTDAVAVGGTALPDPGSEPEYPWMWFGTFLMLSPSVEEDDTWSRIMMTLDTKAMRKVKPGESLVLVSEYLDIVGTPSLRLMVGQMRTLLGT